jgi:MFS family permease
VTLTPTPIALVLSAYMSARLIRTLGRRLFAVSAVLMGTSVIMLMMTLPGRSEAPSVWELLPAMILLGIGQGLAVPAMLNLALLDVPARHAGAASGVLQTIQQLTSAVGVAVLGLAFFEVLGDGTDPDSYVDAFRSTMLVVLGLHATLFGLHFALPKRLEAQGTPELVGSSPDSL